MHSFSLICYLAFAASIDNLGVGLAYGLQDIRIAPAMNVLLAVESLAAAYLCGLLAAPCAAWLGVDFAQWLAAAVLIGLGLAALRETSPSPTTAPTAPLPFWQLLAQPEAADSDGSRHLDWRETLVLGLALAANAAPCGFAGALLGLPPLSLAVLVGLGSFITVSGGILLGRLLAPHCCGRYANQLGGVLLIVLGIYQIFL